MSLTLFHWPSLRAWRPAAPAAIAMSLAAALLAALAGAAPARATEPPVPHWRIESRSAPTNLPLKGEGMVIATAANIGDAEVNGKVSPVTFTDTLPEGLTVTEIGSVSGQGTSSGPLPCSQTKTGQQIRIECTLSGNLASFEQLELRIRVKTELGASAEPENRVSVTGGGAPPEEKHPALKVNGQPFKYGVESFEVTPEDEQFREAHSAGSHPFQFTATLTFNQTYEPDPGFPTLWPSNPTLLKSLNVKLPPGLVGNANVVGNPALPQQCADDSFGSNGKEGTNACPGNTVIGVAAVTFNDPILLKYDTLVVPVFNLVPAPGEPAKFGIDFNHVPIVADTAVRTGGDYGVTVSVHNASQSVQVLSTRVTIWGVPNDERHKSARGWECITNGSHVRRFVPPKPCEPLSFPPPAQPFLLLPTSCENPLRISLEGEAWDGQQLTGDTEYSSKEPLRGCNELPFEPSIGVSPDQHSASTPTGMTVKVHLPQQTTLEANGKAEADVRSSTLALPAGMQASAGAANLLEACSAQQIGWNLPGNGGFSPSLPEERQVDNNDFSPTLPEPTPALPEPPCPQASKIGTIDIKTPLLKEHIKGGAYLAAQDTNPFASPLALYIVAQEPTSKVLVKLAGEVVIDPTTGELVGRFRNTPQAPFEDLTLHLFNGREGNGERSAQATPAHCGEYHATASFEDWSVAAETSVESNPEEFKITKGPGGTGCPGATLPFNPEFTAGPENTQAGAFTPFRLTIERPDGSQALTGASVRLPPGAAAMISSVTPCPIAVADVGQCPSASFIGHVTTSAGLGGSPVTLGGEAFLTESFDGAPFGVSILTRATEVGPFNIGEIVANSTINVDPSTAVATITVVETRILEFEGHSGHFEFTGRVKMANEPLPPTPVPTIFKGVPVQLKRVTVTVDRQGFEFNPTNCNPQSIFGSPMAVTGVLSGSEGASVPVANGYGVTGCSRLPFSPKFTATVAGNASKAEGTTFTVRVESSRGQANIAKTFVALPIALPARLTTIQKACLDATFNANPASCGEGSNIGFAVAHTPALKKPLVGPAYLVSHGNAAFPDVEFVLRGEGITVVLDGKTDIKHGITYSRFEAVPDAPIETFETVFPAGPHSALTSNVPESEHFSLCKQTLSMPTELTGQNGAILKQTTNIAITGCPKVLPFKQAKSKLTVALEHCRKKYKGKAKRKKRLACEAQARKRYAAKHNKRFKQK
jgi:hypothetical protein